MSDDIKVEVESEKDFDIEVIDDTPEPDRKLEPPRRPEGEKPYDVSDEEISHYREGVQERIKKLRFEYHEERRRREMERVAKEQALRENQEAVRLAQQAIAENRRLQEIALRNERIAMESAKMRADSDLERSKRIAREAFEAGDTEKAISAQADIARFAVERDRYAAYVPPELPPAPPPQRQVQQPQQPVQQQVDPRAAEWARKNSWFGSNEEMTGAAYGIHERLVKEGLDPRSDEYYQRLDATIRRRFPENFEGEEAAPTRKSSPVVAPANRSVKTPRKVQLSATQVALANKLGIPLEVYAAELVKANPNG